MTSPCGKIYTILSEEWTASLWFFEPVFIPQSFRENLVLVLGWTAGRRGYVSIATVCPAAPKYPDQHSETMNRSPPPSHMEPTQTIAFKSGVLAAGLFPTELRSHCERTKDSLPSWNRHMSGSTGCGRCPSRSYWRCRERACS